jgi:hypothetical protein
MANEITMTARVAVDNGRYKSIADVGTVQITQAVAGGGNPGVIAASTGGTAISWGTTETIGLVWMRNLSTGTDILLQTTGNVTFSVIKAKAPAIIPRYSSAVDWKVRGSGASASIDIRGFIA